MLGHEISGVVAELGEGVTNVSVGDRVASPFIMPCGFCEYCARGEEELCATLFAENRGKGALYDGTSRLAALDGSSIAMYSMAGFAEYSVVPATAVFKVPDELALEDCSVLGCATFTAFGMLRHTARLQAGETIAIVGTGGVGSAAIQLAGVFGASRVIAIDIRGDKLEAARLLGATDLVNAAEVDVGEAVRDLTAGAVSTSPSRPSGDPATVAVGARRGTRRRPRRARWSRPARRGGPIRDHAARPEENLDSRKLRRARPDRHADPSFARRSGTD